MTISVASLHALRAFRRAASLAALALAASGFIIQPCAHAANGAPRYLDLNGATPGFGSPAGTITDAWTADSTGSSVTGSWVGSSQMTFGSSYGGSDFSGKTFALNSFNGSIGGVQVNSTGANITLGGSNDNALAAAQTWTVASGSVFSSNVTWNKQSNGAYLGVDCNGQNVTLQGGGTFNFPTEIGGNSGGTVTQGASSGDANLTVNVAFAPGSGYKQANYTLAYGTLNFAGGGANAFSMLGTVTGGGTALTINGGTLDNTSGSAMSLGLGSGHFNIGGNFTFAGSSNLDLGANAVTLTASPTIAVNANTLTLGGAISGSGLGLTKAGSGTLKLTGSNSFSGPTLVNQGTLRIATPSLLALPAGLKIMPLGDSITLGDGSSAGSGYRFPLYARLNPLAPSCQFVGASSVSPGALPATPLDQRTHNGRESYSCNDLNHNLDGLDSATFNLYGGAGRDPNGGYWLTGGNGTGRNPVYPDAILLLVGANDINRVGMTGVQARIEALLTKITTLRPAARVFLARITPYLSYPTDVATFNGLIDTVGANFQAVGKNITVVDLNTNFPADGLSGDGVHPSDAGYTWMADRWYDALLSAYGTYPPSGNSLALASTSAVTVAAGRRHRLQRRGASAQSQLGGRPGDGCHGGDPQPQDRHRQLGRHAERHHPGRSEPSHHHRRHLLQGREWRGPHRHAQQRRQPARREQRGRHRQSRRGERDDLDADGGTSRRDGRWHEFHDCGSGRRVRRRSWRRCF